MISFLHVFFVVKLFYSIQTQFKKEKNILKKKKNVVKCKMARWSAWKNVAEETVNSSATFAISMVISQFWACVANKTPISSATVAGRRWLVDSGWRQWLGNSGRAMTWGGSACSVQTLFRRVRPCVISRSPFRGNGRFAPLELGACATGTVQSVSCLRWKVRI